MPCQRSTSQCTFVNCGACRGATHTCVPSKLYLSSACVVASRLGWSAASLFLLFLLCTLMRCLCRSAAPPCFAAESTGPSSGAGVLQTFLRRRCCAWLGNCVCELRQVCCSCACFALCRWRPYCRKQATTVRPQSKWPFKIPSVLEIPLQCKQSCDRWLQLRA